MDTTDPMDRLTLLERAQLLHDATLWGLMEQQARTLTMLTEVAARLDTTRPATRELLDRGRNGR